jgi:DNA-binding CsgD family transcriptional regulator
MKMTDFIWSECEHFRRECNFTPSERKVFDMLAADNTIVEISMTLRMSESAVSTRIKNIKRKIRKVQETE